MVKRWGILTLICILFGSGLSWAQTSFGKMTLRDGSVYVGQFKDGVFNGKGTLNYANGQQYVGEFKDGLFDGQGVLMYTDGSKYEGQFKEGLLNGQGVITYPEDSETPPYKGKFRSGDIDIPTVAPVSSSQAGSTQ